MSFIRINYQTGKLEWIDGGEVKTRDDAYGNPMIRYGARDYYVKYVIWFLHHEVQATKKIYFRDGDKRNFHPDNLLQES